MRIAVRDERPSQEERQLGLFARQILAGGRRVLPPAFCHVVTYSCSCGWEWCGGRFNPKWVKIGETFCFCLKCKRKVYAR